MSTSEPSRPEQDAPGPEDKPAKPRAERIPRRRISWRRSAALCEQELARIQAELAALKDRHLRQSAEFQNYRRRVEDENRTLRQEARGRALAELFPLFDLLDLALGAADQGGSLEDLATGLRMIETQWRALLESAGVTEVPAAGRPFDPTLHEAVQVVDQPGLAPGLIAAVVRKGYRLGDRVLRFARVVVAAAPAPPAAETLAPEESRGNGASPPPAPGEEQERPGNQAGEAQEG